MATKANPAGQSGAAVVERSDGQTDCRDTERQDEWQDQPIDPRLVFLERASARCYLVDHGEMDIDDAITGLIPPCTCAREIYDRMERLYPPKSGKVKRRVA